MAANKFLDSEAETGLFDVNCPECEYAFRMEDPEEGEVIVCSDCALNLKVTAVDPASKQVTLELTKTRGEDWGE